MLQYTRLCLTEYSRCFVCLQVENYRALLLLDMYDAGRPWPAGVQPPNMPPAASVLPQSQEAEQRSCWRSWACSYGSEHVLVLLLDIR